MYEQDSKFKLVDFRKLLIIRLFFYKFKNLYLVF